MEKVSNNNFPNELINQNVTSIVIALSEAQKKEWVKQVVESWAATTPGPGFGMVIVTPNPATTDYWIKWLVENSVQFFNQEIEVYKINKGGILEAVDYSRIGTKCPYVAVADFKAVFDVADSVLYNDEYPLQTIIVDMDMDYSKNDLCIIQSLLSGKTTFKMKVAIPSVSMEQLQIIKTNVKAKFYVAIKPALVSLQKIEKLGQNSLMTR